MRADLAYQGNNTREAAGDTYVSIENLLGSNFGDILAGNNAGHCNIGGNADEEDSGDCGSGRINGRKKHESRNGGEGSDRFKAGYGLDNTE